MKTIYKYTLVDSGNPVPVRMPKGAEVLSIQFQRDALCLWALINVGAEMETRRFRVIGTGWHDIKVDRSDYIATVQDGNLVWHIFEEVV